MQLNSNLQRLLCLPFLAIIALLAGFVVGRLSGWAGSAVASEKMTIRGVVRYASPGTTQALSAQQPTVQLSAAAAAIDNTTAVRYLDLLMKTLSGAIYEEAGRCVPGDGDCGPCTGAKNAFDLNLRENGDDWPAVGHTMIGHRRLRNIQDTLKDVVQRGIPGDFAELGVWRGGGCIMAKSVLDYLGDKERKVFVFDAFEAIPGYANYAKFLAVSEQAVRHNFEKYGVMDDRVIFRKGLFKDTVPAFKKEDSTRQLAVLRVDGNFYDSHQDVFYYMYDMVPVGGYIIFDDYFNGGARAQQAWSDFQNDQNFSETIIRVDNLCGYFRKTKAVKVDMAKMRPPVDVNKAEAK